MEYLEGRDLRATIRAQGRLTPERAIDYAVQVCEGVAEAHARGIVHRDLKPSNLFVTQRSDGSDLIKILDFGISKWNLPDDDMGEATETGIILGSPKYMSPEQVFASSKVDARSDVWSLGAIVYEMLVGRPPFDLPTFAQTCAELSTDRKPPSICAQVPEVPPALEAAVFACFERHVDRRTQTLADLAGALLEAIGSPFAGVVRGRVDATLSSRPGLQRPDSQPRVMVGPFSSGVPSLSATGASPGADGTLGSASNRSRSMQITVESVRPPRKRRGLVLVAVLGACLAGAVAALALDATSPKSDPSPDPSAATVATAAISASPPPVAASPEAAPVAAAPIESPSESAEGKPRVRTPAARPHFAAAPTTVPVPAAPVAAPKSTETSKKNCDPPYTLSSDGIKSYKPECF
jgi:serine/threonine-protein kinase